MSAGVVDQPVTDSPPLEWWQVWAHRRADWWVAHPVLAARWARVRAVGLWIALAWLFVLVVFMPDLRLAMRAYLGCVWVVIAWWALARTKTLTWSGLMRFFAGCVLWSIGVGALSTFLASLPAGLAVTDVGPTAMIAGIAEETLKLAPIAAVAVLAPRRVARFAAVDWLLLGVAAGAAFLAAEETARRVYLMVVDDLFTLGARMSIRDGGVPRDWIRFDAFPLPTDWVKGSAGFGGHAVMTAIVAGLFGLAAVAWCGVRHVHGPGAWGVRALAVAVPAVALLSAVADHVAINVQDHGGRDLNIDGTPLWLDPASSTIAWWVRATWSGLGHGHGRAGVFLLVVVACLVVDAARLTGLPGANLRALPAPRWIRVQPMIKARAATWPRWLSTGVGSVAGGFLSLVWIAGRDISEQTIAGVPEPGQGRLAAARVAGAVASGQRALRESAFGALAEPVHPRRRRLVAGAALGLLLLAALVYAPRAAAAVGELPFDAGSGWFAGVLDAVGGWWHDQPVGTQLAVGAGVAALVVLSGGSLGVAVGVSGVATWGLDKSHGIADFSRDPGAATRSYVATVTPTRLAADTLGVALTFAPGSFAGAATAHAVRTATGEMLADPAAFWAARRLQLGDDAGVLNLDAFLRREPVPLGDGSVQPALTAADEAAAAARYDSYAPTPVKGAPGPARSGQIEVYGANERIVPTDVGNVHPDGFTPQYGAVGDYKHVAADARTWYDPSTIGSEKLAAVASKKMDDTLQRLQVAADEVMGGGKGVVEITTNSSSAAAFIESRLQSLGIRGYVRLVG